MARIGVGTGVGAARGVILGPVGRLHTGQQVQGRACGWVFVCQSGLGAGGCMGTERCHTSKLFYQYGQDFSLYLTIFLLF